MKSTTLHLILGFIIGVICTLIVVFLYFRKVSSDQLKPEIQYFEKVGAVMPYKKVEVHSVYPDGSLRAFGLKHDFIEPDYDCYIPGTGKRKHYNNQVITLSSGEDFRQIGLYTYKNAMGETTIPIVKIVKKKR